ncbi:hypothetical protein PFAG_04228 [Plasmodium falciparum Santa Lucia]|uniref:Uncharacterized protein n=1 Tax=Plasmodium falciparum Santa Lucia TaxID=478859 RepID=W7FPQ8_PLAFA|nr:hypothetical protein PFAG_04228 [Plasmodium falciparum Santa Lucia]
MKKTKKKKIHIKIYINVFYYISFKINIIFFKLQENIVVISTIIIILHYILRYFFDNYYESSHDIYVVYAHNNYCSKHFYVIYNRKTSFL